MHKNAWEIENIDIYIENEAIFLRKFIIYDDSNLIQQHLFKIAQTTDFINEIQNSAIKTGIMIANMQINHISIYFFVLDNRIFIIKRINIPKFQEYFNKHLDSLIFLTLECKDDFSRAISSENQILYPKDLILTDQQTINKAIKKEIVSITIKKSQYRTIKMRHEILPDKFNSKNDKNYKLDDFFSIQKGFNLYYNSKDQILNFLKFYKNDKNFDHEINFYHQIENTFPFICKIFGIIKQRYELPIIILEYVEGKRLDSFLLSANEIQKLKSLKKFFFQFITFIQMDFI